MTIRLEELALADELSQILHLGAVGRDDAHIDLLVENTLTAYLLEIVLQHSQRQLGLRLVDTPEGLADKLLAGIDI